MAKVPDKKMLLRLGQAIGPETIPEFQDRIVGWRKSAIQGLSVAGKTRRRELLGDVEGKLCSFQLGVGACRTSICPLRVRTSRHGCG